jgi:hypothetical protein
MNDSSDNPTKSDFISAARLAKFFDGTTIADTIGTQSVAALFAAAPDRYAVAPTPGHNIYWRPGYEVGKTGSELNGAVMHELLHNMVLRMHRCKGGLV